MSDLWKHQSEAIEKAKNLNHFGLFFEAGTGKTRTCIELLRSKYREANRVRRTLIFGPQVVVENWRREILRFSKIPKDSVIPLIGTGKERLKTFLLNSHLDPIFITNYESVLMKDLFEQMMIWKPEVLVLDESHRVKNYQAKRTKAIVQLADLAEVRYILTGTPILNSLLDIWAQFRVLDRGEAFSKNFFQFRNMYFYDANSFMPAHRHFPNWKLKTHAECLIEDEMNKCTMHVKKAECLDLPPLVRKTVYVGLSPEQAKHYESMKKNFITFINDKACTAQLAITKALRLQQIVSGFMKLDPEPENPKGIVLSLKDNPRADALEEILEDLCPKHKVIVWAVFRDNYETIRKVCEKLELSFVEIHGDVSPKQKQEAIDRFERDETVRVVIGHPGSGGIGVNLVAASYSVFYSRNFSLEQDIQAEARNYRGGSERHESVTRIDIVAKDTIDEHILEALAKKQSISDLVLKDISREL